MDVVEPKYRPPTVISDMNRKSPEPFKGSTGCLVFVAFAILVVALIRCTPATEPGNLADTATNNVQEALATAITAQTTPPVEPLSKARVRRGFEHLKLAMSGEGLAGEMIYSQNCYDMLSRKFSWAKLDECGAADAEAIQLLGDTETTGFDKEAAWFENEAAAGRYLKAAIAAGQDPDAADTRLSDLQAAVRRADAARAAKAAKAAPAAPLMSEGDPFAADNAVTDVDE